MDKKMLLKELQAIQEKYFFEAESKWYKFLDQAIEELEYEEVDTK